MRHKRPLDNLRESLDQIAIRQQHREEQASKVPFDHEEYRRQYQQAIDAVGRDEMLRRTMEMSTPKGGPKP